MYYDKGLHSSAQATFLMFRDLMVVLNLHLQEK